MPTAMEIPVSVPGIGDAIRQMGALARQVKAVGSANVQLSGSTRAVSQATRRQVDPQRNLEQLLNRGPQGRLRRLQAAMQIATPDQQQELGIQVAQAQRRLLMLQRRGAGAGGVLGRVGEAVLSSRVGAAGPQVLVSRIVDVLESLPGPIGLATKVVGVFAAAVITATKNIAELTSAAVLSGGSIREVATLRGLGIDPSTIASRSAALRERLLSDPNAVGAANRLGLPRPMPIIAGDQNNARILLQAADAIRKLTRAEDRLREARLLGEESLVELARVSDYVYANIKQNAAATAVVVDQAAQQAQADLSAGWGQFVDSIKLLGTSIGIGPLKDLAPWLNAAAYAITGVALAVKMLSDFFRTIFPGLSDLMNHPFIKWLMGKMGVGGDSASDSQTDALNKNTDALNKNTQMLAPGIYGGGERARGALPGALTGPLLNRGMEGNAIRLGAFGLG